MKQRTKQEQLKLAIDVAGAIRNSEQGTSSEGTNQLVATAISVMVALFDSCPSLTAEFWSDWRDYAVGLSDQVPTGAIRSLSRHSKSAAQYFADDPLKF